MNDAKHTPGPWIVDEFSNLDFWFVLQPRPSTDDEPNGDDAVAQVYKCMEEGSGKANANLISAAPELLRENESATASLSTIISQLEQADFAAGPNDDAWIDVSQLADELKLIRVCLGNIARKAQGGDK